VISYTAKLKALGALPGVKYNSWGLYAHDQLREHTDTSGQRVWLDTNGTCWADTGVIINNTYTGERTAPKRID
jgi:hypothetical protein